MSRKPIAHGRDHRPGGTDPIPGLSAGGGIQFDTYPQVGDWLFEETTGEFGAGTITDLETRFASELGSHPNPFHVGQLLMDSGGHGLTVMAANSGTLYLYAWDFGAIEQRAYQIDINGTAVTIGAGNQGMILGVGDGGGFVLNNQGADMQFQQDGGHIVFSIQETTDKLVVSTTAHGPIFEIREDGTIHGLASVGAITWDLT